MPPNRVSRHRFTRGILNGSGRTYLTDRVPFRFRELADNRIHQVRQGDTLWTLGGHYFRTMDRGCGFWWVIADFQPEPIIDPTLRLEPGRILFIPSSRTLSEQILFEDRRRLH